MRKEILIAIVAGVFFGILIAFGVWRANSAITNQKEANSSAKQDQPQEQDSDPKAINGLTLIKPDDFDVFTSSETTISGLTKPNSIIFISTEEIDYTLLADEKGEFNQNVTLVGGTNQIIIKSFTDKSNPEEKLTLFFSSQVKGQNKESSETNVEERIENATQKIKGFLGTLTDISESTLQLENEEGTIQQISTTQDTTYAKSGANSEEIEYKDLAIGDFLLAMGALGENSVVTASRILVTAKSNDPQRAIKIGVVEETSSNEFTLEKDLQSIQTNRYTDVFLFNDNTLIDSNTNDIGEKQEIIVSYGQKDTKNVARNIVIYKVPSPTPTE